MASSHDCQILGSIGLSEGIAKDAVREALQGFLDEVDIDYDVAIAENSISFEVRMLFLNISCRMPYFRNEIMERFTESLADIAAGPDNLEVMDFDTGDASETCTPYFIGKTETEKKQAQLEYGIGQMLSWASPIIGDEAADRMAEMIRLQPIIT